jgi:hypothetical protein
MTPIAAIAAATGATLVALVFFRAAFHKATAFAELTGYVADYRFVPERLVPAASAALAAAEAATVALLAVPATVRLGALLAAALLALYAAAMALNIARGRRHIECGCGGAPQVLSGALLLRNAVLAAAALAVAAVPPAGLGAADAAGAVAGGLVLFLVFLAVEQVLATDGRIRTLP